MSAVEPWIYIDHSNNIWKFYLNDNNELLYNIMYSEGKWTKESVIDTGIKEFTIYLEEDETIHIVYYNINRELKYCTLKSRQWFGKLLRQLNDDEYEISDLKVEILGEDMHIFYIQYTGNSKNIGILKHLKWDGKNTEVNVLLEMKMVDTSNEKYSVQVTGKNNIQIFFLNDEGDEVSLKYLSYQRNRWNPIRRLYVIQGEDISVEILNNQQEVHILNKYGEDAKYFLEHVLLDINGTIQHFRVNESISEPTEAMLFMESNKLYACWLEHDKIFYSCYNGRKWDRPVEVERNNDYPLTKFKCFLHYERDNSTIVKGVYGVSSPDLCLYIPNQFIKNKKESMQYQSSHVDFSEIPEDEEDLRAELIRVRAENKKLEKEIASLNMQLRKKQRLLEEHEESIARIMEQKRKTEENYNVYLEVQQNIQKELVKARQQLSESKKNASDLAKRLKEFEDDNKMLKSQLDEVKDENEKLREEIQLMKNKSLVNRLFKKYG